MTPDPTTCEGRYELRRMMNEHHHWTNHYRVAMPAALDHIDQQAAEISRLRSEVDTDADQILAMAGSHWVSEETKRMVEEKRELQVEIARLRSTLAEALRMVGEIVNLEDDIAGIFKTDSVADWSKGDGTKPIPSTAGATLVKLAATLSAAKGETT